MKRVMFVTLLLVIPSFVAFYGWSQGQGGGSSYQGQWFARYKEPTWRGDVWREVHAGDEAAISDAKNRWERQVQIGLSIDGRLRGNDRAANLRMIRQFSESSADIATEVVNLRVIDQEAVNAQVQIGDDELFQQIIVPVAQDLARTYPEQFQGQTASEIWKFYTRQQGINEEVLLAVRGRELRRQHVETDRRGDAIASLDDLWNMHVAETETIEAEWVSFPVDDYEEQAVISDADLATFFEENADDYAFGDRREYSYVYLKRSDLEEVEVTTDALRAYYEEHATDYIEPANVQVRAIQISTLSNETYTTEAAKAYLDKIDRVKELVFAPDADFAALANEHTEDVRNRPPGANREPLGGLLQGVISNQRSSGKGDLFDITALAMEEGETTGPVYTERGAFFLRAEKTNPERSQPFEECRARVELDAERQLANQRFDSEAERFEVESKRQTTMAALATAMGAKLRTNVTVDKDDFNLPDLAYALYNEQNTLTDLDRDDPKTPVMKTPSALVVVMLQREIAARPAKLDEVTTAVRDHLTRLRATDMAKAAAQAFAESVTEEGAEFAALAAELDSSDTYTTGSFTRRSPLFGTIDYFSDLTQNITTDTVRADLSVSPYMQIAGNPWPLQYITWKVTGIDRADRVEFLETAAAGMRQAAIYHGEAMFQEWLIDRRREIQFELAEMFQ